MMFCKKCGSIMVAKKGKNACSCGYVSKETPSRIKEKIIRSQVEIQVVEEEIGLLPTVEEECSKCGHKKAHYWTMQTRAADEAETKFLKCEKCRHTWRDYS